MQMLIKLLYVIISFNLNKLSNILVLFFQFHILIIFHELNTLWIIICWNNMIFD